MNITEKLNRLTKQARTTVSAWADRQSQRFPTRRKKGESPNIVYSEAPIATPLSANKNDQITIVPQADDQAEPAQTVAKMTVETELTAAPPLETDEAISNNSPARDLAHIRKLITSGDFYRSRKQVTESEFLRLLEEATDLTELMLFDVLPDGALPTAAPSAEAEAVEPPTEPISDDVPTVAEVAQSERVVAEPLPSAEAEAVEPPTEPVSDDVPTVAEVAQSERVVAEPLPSAEAEAVEPPTEPISVDVPTVAEVAQSERVVAELPPSAETEAVEPPTESVSVDAPTVAEVAQAERVVAEPLPSAETEIAPIDEPLQPHQIDLWEGCQFDEEPPLIDPKIVANASAEQLDRPLASVDISKRIVEALAPANISTLGQIATLSEAHLVHLKGVGRSSAQKVAEVAHAHLSHIRDSWSLRKRATYSPTESIGALKLSPKLIRTYQSAGVERIDQLLDATPAQIMGIRGIGSQNLRRTIKVLNYYFDSNPQPKPQPAVVPPEPEPASAAENVVERKPAPEPPVTPNPPKPKQVRPKLPRTPATYDEIVEAAQNVLRLANRPLHYRSISKRLLQKLNTSADKIVHVLRTDRTFTKLDAGKFTIDGLRDWGKPTSLLGSTAAPQFKAVEYPAELARIEKALITQLKTVDWIGELPVTRLQFEHWALLTRKYGWARSRPALEQIPPALFVSTLVFTARYIGAEDRNFWQPYVERVWQLEEDTVNLESKARWRYKEIVEELAHKTGLSFPRQSDGDLVRPIYRHALIPAYLQPEFAQWLSDRWRSVLTIDSHLLLMQLKSIHYLSPRLKQFLTGAATREAAFALIQMMAQYTYAYRQGDASAEQIELQLTNNLIARDIWRQLMMALEMNVEAPIRTRLQHPRLDWIWSQEDHELSLRLTNLITDIAPERIVWVTANEEGEQTDVAHDVYEMVSGQYLLDETILIADELEGQLQILDEVGHEIVTLPIPPVDIDEPLFFKEGAGEPTLADRSKVVDGAWSVLLPERWQLHDAHGRVISAEAELVVPFPLEQANAGFYGLKLPVLAFHNGVERFRIEPSPTRDVNPILSGAQLHNLSPLVPQAFTTNQITLQLESITPRWIERTALVLTSASHKEVIPFSELEVAAVAQQSDVHLVPLQHLIPAQAGAYTIQMVQGVKPLLAEPLRFTLLTHIEIEPPDADCVYSSAVLPRAYIHGVEPDQVKVKAEWATVSPIDGGAQIEWHKLRHDCLMELKLNDQLLLLGWRIGRMISWTNPDTRPIQEHQLSDVQLHVVAPTDKLRFPNAHISYFHIGVGFNQDQRRYDMSKHGHKVISLATDQLRDMILARREARFAVSVQMRDTVWQAFTVERKVPLRSFAAEYQNRQLRLTWQLSHAWLGDFRAFLRGPDEVWRELGFSNALRPDGQLFDVTLDSAGYDVRLLCYGECLAEATVRHVQAAAAPDVMPPVSVERMRRDLVTRRRLERFVLAQQSGPIPSDLADAYLPRMLTRKSSLLKPKHLFQLATLSAETLQQASPEQLADLWPPLAMVAQTYQPKSYRTMDDLLPAWAITSTPVRFKWVIRQQTSLTVYPEVAAHKLAYGVGYAERRLWGNQGKRVRFRVRWWPSDDGMRTHLALGIPDDRRVMGFTELDDDDCWSLYRCGACNRLFGRHGGLTTREHEQDFLLHKQRCADAHLVYIIDTEPLRVQLDMRYRDEDTILSNAADAIDNVYLDAALRSLPKPPDETSSDSSADAYRYAVYCWAQRLHTRPNVKEISLAMVQNRKWKQGLRELNLLLKSSDEPHFAATHRLLGPITSDTYTPLLSIDDVIVQLALLLRVEAHGGDLRKQLSFSKSDVEKMLVYANQVCPELLGWALMWVEIFYIHTHS